MAATERNLTLLTDAINAIQKDQPNSIEFDFFPKDAFAKIDAFNFHTNVHSLRSVIGNEKSQIADLKLPMSWQVKDRHALLSYNFEKEAFEIQCLSDVPIYINNTCCSAEYGPMDLPSGYVYNENVQSNDE